MDTILNLLSSIFVVLGTILFQFWGWTIIAAYLGYLIWQNNRKIEYISNAEHTLLHIIVPKDNDKKELSAEQMFASLHGILRPSGELMKEGVIQDHISFEIVSLFIRKLNRSSKLSSCKQAYQSKEREEPHR